MRLTQQLSAVLCGLALAAFSVTASAQEQTPSPAPSPSPTPAPDLRAKIISAERALAGAQPTYYKVVMTPTITAVRRDRNPVDTVPRARALWDDARAAVSDQIGAGARTLRAALVAPETLNVAPESTTTVAAAGTDAPGRTYMPPPPKPSMVNRLMGFTSVAAGFGGIGAAAGGASALLGNYFSLGSSTLNSGTTLMGLFKGSKALKKTNSDVDTAIGKGVDEATQKAAAHAVATSLKLEFLYAVAALKQVADELNLIEVAASGKPMDLEPLADRYIAAIELSEEIFDIELPRLGVMAALASQAAELPEETRAKYKAVGERIVATVEQWRANRTRFARSERNAMDFLAMAPEPVVTGTQISSGRP